MNLSIVKLAITAGLLTCVSVSSAQESNEDVEYPQNYAQDFLVVHEPPEGGWRTCWALRGVVMRHNLIKIPGVAEPTPAFVHPLDHRMIFQPEGRFSVYVKDFDYSWKSAASYVGLDYDHCVNIWGMAIFGSTSKVGDPGKVNSGI